ncbi:MAG: ribosome-associated translation inhibitor RaiA [Clostridiales Family XIII bacterium]|jgi:putative sigma-54 modulation protein|nr:ribosome-associated translation inhibitor RaiA [Clostridiales Family XIII bacterium]
MKINITSKNLNASEHLRDTIEDKIARLGKFFSDEIEANVTLSLEKGRQKIEATINAGRMIFRAEEDTQDIYGGIDRIVDKLSGQITKYKRKLAGKHKDNKAIVFEGIPDYSESEAGSHGDDIEIVRRKKFELLPMAPEEAVLQMELVGHSFFVFLDMETDGIGVVYKRNDGKYGLLETTL